MATNYPNLTRMLSRSGIVIGLTLALVFMAGGCMTSGVGAGEAAVKYSSFSGTDKTESYGEGIHLHAPWTRLITYDVRVQEKLEELSALSSNGLTIEMDVSIRWRPREADLPALHQTYGTEYYRKLIQPELRSVLRQVVGRFTPEELYSSKREELQTQIEERVTSGVEPNFIDIEAVLIRRIELPLQIRTAIEKKLTEEQEAERYEFTLQKEALEAERKEIEALGQAEYQRIITQSLSPQFLKFKGIEATLKLAESENSKVVVVGGGGDGLPLILGNQ